MIPIRPAAPTAAKNQQKKRVKDEADLQNERKKLLSPGSRNKIPAHLCTVECLHRVPSSASKKAVPCKYMVLHGRLLRPLRQCPILGQREGLCSIL
jgi:hypothetical protein